MKGKLLPLCATILVSSSSACWLNFTSKSKFDIEYEKLHATLYDTQVIRDYAKEVSGNCKPSSEREGIAIVMVDMQDTFLDVKPDIMDQLREPMELLDYCIENGVPVVVLETESGKPTRLLEDRINRLSQKVYINKPGNDGFKDTILGEQLRCYGVGKIFLMGAYASACVLDTAKGAVDAGFDVAISGDTVFDQALVGILFPEITKAAIEWYQNNVEVFYSYKDFLESLADEESKR